MQKNVAIAVSAFAASVFGASLAAFSLVSVSGRARCKRHIRVHHSRQQRHGRHSARYRRDPLRGDHPKYGPYKVPWRD